MTDVDFDTAETSAEEKQRIKDFISQYRKPPCDCDKCGQRIRPANPHRMDSAKVSLLRQIATKNQAGHEWVKLQRDGNLIKVEERDFTIQIDDVHGRRLKWFGLVEDKARRSGTYKVTRRGYDFLRGAIEVPAVIMCRDGVVVAECPVHHPIHKVRDVILGKEYWDNYGRNG